LDGQNANSGWLGTRNEELDSRSYTYKSGFLTATDEMMSLWKIVEKEGGVMLQ